MAYGFEAKNDSGNVIINDTIENLHFVGKATRGSNNSDYGNFPGYGGSNDSLDGRVVHYYTITCTGTPVAFIKPTDYARWHGIIKQSVSGTTWSFDVMISGTSTSNPPEIYCFVNADDVPSTSETHGMIVFKSDGTTKTFDSRVQPLAITGGANAVAPSDPTNSSGLPGTSSGHSWNYSSNDHDFRCTNRYNEYTDSNINTSNTMFACPSLAQAVYKRQQHGYKESCGFLGCCCQDHHSTAAWWVMYRSAFRLRTNKFDAGWSVYSAGYSFSSSFESGGWFGGGGGSYSTGSMPYTAKTINLQSNAYIIADSSRYD
jgi:hypothetical protein|tara:strand:- start:759 stop:1706 length:948 start_codon:yes stop_codon:yes gene_type:complete